MAEPGIMWDSFTSLAEEDLEDLDREYSQRWNPCEVPVKKESWEVIVASAEPQATGELVWLLPGKPPTRERQGVSTVVLSEEKIYFMSLNFSLIIIFPQIRAIFYCFKS